MVKCPRGTPSQVKANNAYLNKTSLFNVESTYFSWVYDSIKGHMVNVGEKESESTIVDSEGSELDSNKADKRWPPTPRDELVYFFISCFLDILLESWDGKPCVKPKLGPYPSDSQDSELMGEDLGPCDCSFVSSTAEYLKELYQKRMSNLSKETFKKNSEETESECFNEEDFDSCVSLDPLNVFVPDENVHFVFKNGVWYKGRVSRRLMDGEGYYFWEDGTTYQGEFEGGCVTGKGRLEFPDLSVYDGGVYKAFRHGDGMFCFSECPITYSGQWWLGKKHGSGLIVYNDPTEGHNFYKGQWQDGFKEGFGFRQYPSGATYTGFWCNGKRHGKGVMLWGNNDVYRGEWKDGLMHGYGEYTWKSIINKSLTYPCCNIYRGYWAYGKKNGRGLFELKNGTLVETNWVDDMKEGIGAVICENGFIVASEEMFHKDKPTLFTYSESCKKTASPTKGKKNEPSPCNEEIFASIPILAPVYTLRLYPYSQKLSDQKRQKILKNLEKSQLEKLMSQKENSIEQFMKCKRMNYELSEDQKNELLECRIAEEKRLRNFIILKISELRNCYDYYATLPCEKPPLFPCLLLRWSLWQIFIDAELCRWNLSLVDIDNLIACEEHILIDCPHNPFERFQFWQFIHILIFLSWHLYGQFVFGEDPLVEDIKIKNFLTHYESSGCKYVLKTAFEYFITNDVFKGRFHEKWCPPCNQTMFEESDLAPMKAMYLIYSKIGEPHSARDFLNAICQNGNEVQPLNVQYFEKLPHFKMQGKNVLSVGGELQHVTEEEPFNFPEISQMEENKVKINPDSEMAYFNDLKIKKVIKCLKEVCPGIMTDDYIVNMDYQLTFLEFYKVVILCTKLQLKIKAMDAVRDDLIANYKNQMEEYKKQMVEFEKMKESHGLLRKKSRQFTETPKKGKK